MQRVQMPGEAAANAPRVGCVVMASGVGRRFGSQKLLAPFDGATVIERTLSAVPADVVDTVVVTRSAEVAGLCERLGVACAVHEGALKSDTIRCGLDALGDCAACMFLPGDQPLVSQKSMRALVAEALAYPDCIVRLAWRGEAASPQVFPAALFGKLRAIRGDAGGLSLLKEYPALRDAVRLVEAQRECEIWDIDTPDDLERMEDALGRPRRGSGPMPNGPIRRGDDEA